MLIKYFYDDKLAQASYLVGCSASGTAIVIDPSRDIRPYLQLALTINNTQTKNPLIYGAFQTYHHADKPLQFYLSMYARVRLLLLLVGN